MAAEKGIGARVVRKEDQRFVTGKGRYTDDINQHGQVYAQFVRSPHAHARVSGIDSQGRYVINEFTGNTFAEDNVIRTSASLWRLKLGVSYRF